MNYVPYVCSRLRPAIPNESVSKQAELTDLFLAVMAPDL